MNAERSLRVFKSQSGCAEQVREHLSVEWKPFSRLNYRVEQRVIIIKKKKSVFKMVPLFQQFVLTAT